MTTLFVCECSIPFQYLHQNGIRSVEIVELSSQPVLPLHPMKQVVAVAEDDDHDGGYAISRIIVTALDNRADECLTILIPQMQMIEMVGELAVSEIAPPEILQFRNW